ncbi:uncharacterized protein LOC144051876 [Vanacampus margaritifer]
MGHVRKLHFTLECFQQATYSHVNISFKMLACCFMVTTFLAVSFYPGVEGRPNVLMVAPTVVMDAHPQAEVTIKCGDGDKAGVVLYWHTPFGPLRRPGIRTKPVPVHMRQDGSLVVHNLSDLHQGLYYCLLRHDDGGSTLFPYQLHTNPQDGGRGPRFRRGLGRQETVSDELFVGAVTAAVLLTFVFGFSAGAASRAQILRCLSAVTKRLPPPRQRRPDITMTTLTSWPSSPSSPSSSLSSSCPPAKPQRSFRDKRGLEEKQEDNRVAAYLEACDHGDDGKGRATGGGGEDEEGRRKRSRVKDEQEVREDGSFVGMVEKIESGGEGDDEDKQEKKNDKDDRKNTNDDEDERKNRMDDEEKNVICQSSQPDEDENQEVEYSPPQPRTSRVIRVYQYDQDGRRYGHLPDPEPSPAPRIKQRSVSLTRLNAIMAAASPGPMDATPQKVLSDVEF